MLMHCAVAAPTGDDTPAFALPALIAMARESSPALAVARADEPIARAALTTAAAYPNPDLSIEPGHGRPRWTDGRGGASSVVGISQPIELPGLRDARQRAARAGIEVAGARIDTTRASLSAAIRVRFYDIIRFDEEILAFREDMQITEQIRDRILLRVDTGEAPRFDLVRAEGEVDSARKNLGNAIARRRQAMADLRGLVGPALPASFTLRHQPGPEIGEAEFLALRRALPDRNPDIGLARRQLEQAELQLTLEQRLVLPQVTLRMAQERDPELSTTRIGAQITLPLLNRREGPIAEARAQVERARLLVTQRSFEAEAALDAAWYGYLAAQGKVQALEQGVLDRARRALAIAESAYRLGERGILEYLDAQRQYRLARNELITARLERLTALSDIDRLLGTP